MFVYCPAPPPLAHIRKSFGTQFFLTARTTLRSANVKLGAKSPVAYSARCIPDPSLPPVRYLPSPAAQVTSGISLDAKRLALNRASRYLNRTKLSPRPPFESESTDYAFFFSFLPPRDKNHILYSVRNNGYSISRYN